MYWVDDIEGWICALPPLCESSQLSCAVVVAAIYCCWPFLSSTACFGCPCIEFYRVPRGVSGEHEDCFVNEWGKCSMEDTRPGWFIVNSSSFGHPLDSLLASALSAARIVYLHLGCPFHCQKGQDRIDVMKSNRKCSACTRSSVRPSLRNISLVACNARGYLPTSEQECNWDTHGFYSQPASGFIRMGSRVIAAEGRPQVDRIFRETTTTTLMWWAKVRRSCSENKRDALWVELKNVLLLFNRGDAMGDGKVGIESKNSRQTIFVVVVVAAAVVLLVLIWVGDTTIRINTKWRRSNKLCEISQFFNTSLTLGWPSRIEASLKRQEDGRGGSKSRTLGLVWWDTVDRQRHWCWRDAQMLESIADARLLLLWLHFMIIGRRTVDEARREWRTAHDQLQIKLQSDFFALLDWKAHPLPLSQSFGDDD